jgi:hypothetical protein
MKKDSLFLELYSKVDLSDIHLTKIIIKSIREVRSNFTTKLLESNKISKNIIYEYENHLILFESVARNNNDVLKILLKNSKVNLNARDFSILRCALNTKNYDAFKMILRQKQIQPWLDYNRFYLQAKEIDVALSNEVLFFYAKQLASIFLNEIKFDYKSFEILFSRISLKKYLIYTINNPDKKLKLGYFFKLPEKMRLSNIFEYRYNLNHVDINKILDYALELLYSAAITKLLVYCKLMNIGLYGDVNKSLSNNILSYLDNSIFDNDNYNKNIASSISFIR